MHDVIQSSIEAHGGLVRWNQVKQVSAGLVPDGLALKLRGQEAFARSPTNVIIDTQQQRAIFNPFLASERRGIFEPNRTAIESAGGAVLEELINPRESFRPDTRWSAAQLAYFVGYAMWTYLTLPFSLLRGGVECEEVEPWAEGGETWRVLKINFPKSYVTHSSEQLLYFDSKGMIRRQDYSVDIAAGSTAAHYLYGHQRFDGIIFPTRRRIYPRGLDRQPNRDVVLMAADLGDFVLSGPTA